jgi:hypothetical protein
VPGAPAPKQTIEDELVQRGRLVSSTRPRSVQQPQVESRRRQLLDQLVEAVETSGFEAGTGASNVMMVDQALMPGGPFRPSLRRSLMLGLMLVSASGLAVSSVGGLDRTLKTADVVAPRCRSRDRVDLAATGSSRRGACSYYYGKSSKKQARL